MATRVKLETKGFSEYLERIAKAGKNVDKAAAEALEAGGEILRDGMKRRVRKDTRNLEEHIVVDGPHQDGNYNYVLVGVVNADPDTARYGNAQEYGSSSMQAQPYIRPALDEDMARARKAMRKAFEKAME